MSESREESRRDFFRHLALGVLTLGTGALTAKSRGPLLEAPCLNQGVCRGCRAFADGGLPQALSARQAGMKDATWQQKIAT